MNLQIAGMIIVGLLCGASYVVYIRDIIRGITKPERASWFIWSVLGLIALTSQYALGARASLVLVLTQTIGVTLIFILSLWRGVGLPGYKDIMALFFAGLGLLLWYFTESPLVALVIVIAIDAIGVVLTAIKAYSDPYSETVSAWVLAGLAGTVTLCTLQSYSLGIVLYPIYTILLNVVVLSVIYLARQGIRYHP